MVILTNFEFFLPEIFLTVNLLLILLYSVVYSYKSNQPLLDYKLAIRNFSLLNLLLTLALLFVLNFSNFEFISGSLLLSNSLIVMIKIIILLSSIVILLLDNKFINYEFSLLITLANLGMMVILSSNDLIILYLGIELLSLTLYILATLNNKGELSTEAGLKYFIIGAVSSGLLLIGCALIYSNTGFTDYINIENFMFYDNSINIGGILIIISMLIKLAVAPFHM
jgi:NADH-quinone oxidoreductase subunit N